MEKGRVEFNDPNFTPVEGICGCGHSRLDHGRPTAIGYQPCNVKRFEVGQCTCLDFRRASPNHAEIEWLQSLLDHIEKGEIELVKESIGGAIEILGRK